MKSILIIFFCAFTAAVQSASVIKDSSFLTLAWLSGVDSFTFKASQSSQCEALSTGETDLRNCITRNVSGIVAKDGRYRYEIENLSGPDKGTRWVIAYNGKVTSILESINGVNSAFIKRGPTSEDPFLARVNPVLLPFMFLKEKSLLPGDMGTYLSVSDLAAGELIQTWLKDANLKSESTSTIELSHAISASKDQHFTVSVVFDKEANLPQSVHLSSSSGNEDQTQQFQWKKWKIKEGAEVSIPFVSTVTLYSVFQGLKCNFKSEIVSFEVQSAVPNSSFEIDLSKVDRVYDRDQDIIIPLKKE